MSRVASHGLNGISITASDATTYNEPNLQALYIGTGGTLVVTTADGTDITFTNLPNGSWLPIVAYKVKSTGTTASSILGFY